MESKLSVPRYKIQIEVSDTSDSTTFTIFDKEAEKLIGKTAKELAHMQFETSTENIIPREIEAIVSREYVFQLKLTEYNLIKGLENYTITKVFELLDAKQANIQKDLSQNSMPLSLPAEDTDSNSDDDDISLKALCKRRKMSQKQIVID